MTTAVNWCMQPNLISKQTNSNQFTVMMKVKASSSIIALYLKSDQNQCLFAGYWLWIEESRSDTGHVPPPHTGHWGQCWVWCDMGRPGLTGVRVTILHGSTMRLGIGKTHRHSHHAHVSSLLSRSGPTKSTDWSSNIPHCLLDASCLFFLH